MPDGRTVSRYSSAVPRRWTSPESNASAAMLYRLALQHEREEIEDVLADGGHHRWRRVSSRSTAS